MLPDGGIGRISYGGEGYPDTRISSILHHGEKLVEKIAAVMRSRCGFRVVLHGESRTVFQPDAFDGVIIEVHVGDFRIRRIPHGNWIHAETVVLRSDLANAGDEVFNGMVESPVSMVHLEGGDTIREGKQLMTQTDSK